MSGLRLRLPFRLWPRRAEEAAKGVAEAAGELLSALDDEFCEARADAERAWATGARERVLDWLDDIAAQTEEFTLPDPADAETDREVDRRRDEAMG